MKVDTLIEAYQRKCTMQEYVKSVKGIYGVFSLFMFSKTKACPEHISESIQGNSLKLNTWIEGHHRNAKCKNRHSITSIYGAISLPMFCSYKRLSGAYF